MIERIKLEQHVRLEDYASRIHLAPAVERLRAEARTLVPGLRRHKVWMLSSTASGGGVAETLPQLVVLLRELGVAVEWMVMTPHRPEFFLLTKRLHNLIHGHGDPSLTSSDRQLYEQISREGANQLRPLLAPGDLLVVHDPQPLAVGAMVKQGLAVHAIWRCHIGIDEETPTTQTAWSFLQPYASVYDHAIFSASEYIRDFLAGRASVICPTIDPLGHKNRELSPHKLVGVLCNAGLMVEHEPVLTERFAAPALRLRSDGSFGPAANQTDIGLLYRPIVTQVSRWDRLKGFGPLLAAFRLLKQRSRRDVPERHRRRLEILRLLLAGPDPTSIADDPEASDVLDELKAAVQALPSALQHDVAVISLPMVSRKQNALMVNALQRCSTVIVQNSIREGFGLTATEGMWKGVAVLGTHAWGLRQQIRDGLDGRLVKDPMNPDEIAQVLDEMLADPRRRYAWGESAQRRVFDEFLVFAELRRWLRTFTSCLDEPLGPS